MNGTTTASMDRNLKSTPSAPGAARASSLALAVTGLAVSAYLTFEHFDATAQLACPDTPVVNCTEVTTSSYSELAGMPIPFLGLLYFVAMTALCSPWAWRARGSRVSGVRLAGAATGVAMVLYLVWVELFRIDAICLWCTIVHTVTVALFGVIALGTALRSDDRGQ